MTEVGAADLHNGEDGKVRKLTERLGYPFAELCEWAVNENLENISEIIYLILGLDARTVGIPNLVEELSHPESQTTLGAWDSQAVAAQFD